MLSNIIRTGLSRGKIELKQSFGLVFNYVFFPSVALAVMYFLRDVDMRESGSSLGHYAIPGILAMNVLFTGMMGLATSLITEREDGTLLRARSVPYGVHGYLIGKVSSQTALTFLTFGVVLLEAAVLFGGFVTGDFSSVLNLTWILPLGMMATLPFGAVLGCLVKNPRNLSFLSLLLMGCVSISGIFYPLAGQAGWMQILGQSMPLYWLGLAIRGALLGDSCAPAEIGGSFRPVETAAVLGLWSFVGTTLAVVVLRRAARHQAGSRSRGKQAHPAAA